MSPIRASTAVLTRMAARVAARLGTRARERRQIPKAGGVGGRAALALFAGLGGISHSAAQEGARLPERHALLVGCDEYPYLREALGERYERELLLHGPSNDVVLVQQTLERVLGLAPERTTVLAGWGEEIQGRPTRANVLGALERLAKEARAGDQVIVYLAGHGSQQRVQRVKTGEEPDGLEEIFLAADVRPAEKDQGYVPNAIKDDELGERVRAIRDAGAEVWLIVDSCHSGTMMRGTPSAGTDVRLRGLDPELLGVTSGLRGGRERSQSERSWIDGSESARIAALYGATSYGRAPEMELPVRTAGRSHGLFSYLLCEELESTGGHATYRELADRIVAAYQAFPCAITVPTAEGDLEREILSGAALDSALVCAFRGGVPCLNQGRLAGLEPGVVVDVLELASGAERSIARVEIVEADLFEARGNLLEGTLAEDAGPWRARMDARPLGDYRLSLALVDPGGSVVAVSSLPESLRLALERERERFPLVAPQAADWWIVVPSDGRFWLRPGPREGGYDFHGMSAERLVETLVSIQKVRNYRRFAGGSFTGTWTGDLDVWVERRVDRGWQRAERGLALTPGDEIRVRLQKHGDAIYDVNVLYLDANYDVSPLFPPLGRSPRLEPGARDVIDLTGALSITDDALGLENVLVFATPRSAASPVLDLRNLEQRGGQLRGGESSAPPDPFEDLLREVTSGANLRGQSLAVREARGTQSLLETLHVGWGAIAPPAWPEESAPIERGERAEEAASTEDPALEPWLVGSRAALARSGGARGPRDLLLLGDAEVEAVLVDFDEGAAADADAAQLARERSFDAEAAFVFAPRRLAFYDRADRGGFDLVLVDDDGDGVAEERAELVDGRWHSAPARVPWLSQSYVRFAPERRNEISSRLQALQRGSPREAPARR